MIKNFSMICATVAWGMLTLSFGGVFSANVIGFSYLVPITTSIGDAFPNAIYWAPLAASIGIAILTEKITNLFSSSDEDDNTKQEEPDAAVAVAPSRGSDPVIDQSVLDKLADYDTEARKISRSRASVISAMQREVAAHGIRVVDEAQKSSHLPAYRKAPVRNSDYDSGYNSGDYLDRRPHRHRRHS